jgi:predicted metal-dependent HD superfamily phosphohydrolase
VPALTTWWSLDVRAVAPQAHDYAVQRSGADLLRRWTEPARRYHTTRHLVEIFWALEELEKFGEIDDRQSAVTRLAAWFHDAVYYPGARNGSNEADSAALARDQLQQVGLADDDIVAIEAMIRVTVNHDAHHEEPLEAAFQDADLWILSAPVERFDGYCDQVRQEYASLADAAYRQGRAAILEALLHRDTIYRTSHALHLWETPARINLGRELARLRA